MLHCGKQLAIGLRKGNIPCSGQTTVSFLVNDASIVALGDLIDVIPWGIADDEQLGRLKRLVTDGGQTITEPRGSIVARHIQGYVHIQLSLEARFMPAPAASLPSRQAASP